METDYDTKGPGNAFKLRKYTAAGFLQIPGCLLRGHRKELEDKLDMIDYAYDPAVNQFV